MRKLLHSFAHHMNSGTNGATIGIMVFIALLTLLGSIATINTRLGEYDAYHKHELDEIQEYVRNIEWYLWTSPTRK